MSNSGLLVVELIEESLWVPAVNPTITIIAIAAAAPPRIPIFLLDEKLNEKLVCESESFFFGFVSNLILVPDFLVDELSNDLLVRCVSISD